MRRRVEFPANHQYIAEKFCLIYMEIKKTWAEAEARNTDARAWVPDKKVRWHLEDEQRPQLALCGFTLEGNVISVSPALAMYGTPCPDCKKIVDVWLTGPKTATTRRARFMDLLRGDIPFRDKVHKVVNNDLFQVNYQSQQKRRTNKSDSNGTNSDGTVARQPRRAAPAAKKG